MRIRSLCSTGLLALVCAGALATPTQAAPTASPCGVVGPAEGVLNYSIQAYAPTSCKQARTVVLHYLRKGKGKAMTRGSYRCTTRKDGTVAEGTAWQVNCKAKGKLRIRAYYRGA